MAVVDAAVDIVMKASASRACATWDVVVLAAVPVYGPIEVVAVVVATHGIVVVVCPKTVGTCEMRTDAVVVGLGRCYRDECVDAAFVDGAVVVIGEIRHRVSNRDAVVRVVVRPDCRLCYYCAPEVEAFLHYCRTHAVCLCAVVDIVDDADAVVAAVAVCIVVGPLQECWLHVALVVAGNVDTAQKD